MRAMHFAPLTAHRAVITFTVYAPSDAMLNRYWVTVG